MLLAVGATGIMLHPLTLGLLGAALVSVVAAAISLLRGRLPSVRPRAEKRLNALYDNSPTPAMIAGTDGRLSWVNGAAGAAGMRRSGWLADQLALLVDADAALIYRLSQRAIKLGFAFAPVRENGSNERRYLAVQATEGQKLLWSVQTSRQEGLRSLILSDVLFEGAGFGHMAVEPGGRIAVNAGFSRLFTLPAEQVLEAVEEQADTTGARTLLPSGRDGLQPYRVFALTDGRTGRRDVLFFRLDEGREEASAPRSVLDAVPVALLRLDPEARILWANPSARALLGAALQIGRPLADLVEPLGRPVAAMMKAAQPPGARGRGDMVRLPREGADTFLQVTLSRAEDDEGSILAVLTDASEMRQLEDQFAQSQKMEAVGKLAGGVAHDFNNVLTAISGHTDLLLLGKDVSHPDYSDLVQIRQNANRAAALVRQLLAFSRKQTLSPEELSLRDVISDTLYLLDRLIGENVTLSFDVEGEVGAVRADQQQLEQALMNLVVNARDAMPDGGAIRITLADRSIAGEGQGGSNAVLPGDYVELAVEDEGPGIPEGLIDRIWEPFFTTKPVGQGTGLGLSTVYGIVMQSGGHISVVNRPEGGARFRILLPRSEPAAARPAPLKPQRRQTTDMTGRGQVLLVEDEAPVRSFARRALELRGYDVKAVEAAEEAMAWLSDPANAVDLIVTDVIMPGMNGPAFAAEARRMRPGLPVIFVSGYAEDSFDEALVEPDFLFLPKPFSLTELTAKVKEALA